MRPNTIRELLRAGRPTYGTHLFSMWPTITEVVGYSRQFDYIEFSGEYAPYDLFALDNFCRAAELHGLGSMIKLDQEPRTWLAQRAIGAGFQSVLFADVRNVEQARACVAAARPDAPGSNGTLGVADRRSSIMNHAGTQRYIDALNDIVVVLMIEKASAVEQLDEILKVPGVDMVQWGPADYSMSVGRPGEWYSPEVRKVERHVFETCIRAGIPPRLELTAPKQAERYLEMGVRHFCMGTDIYILYDWLRENGAELRKLVEAAEGAAPSSASGGATSGGEGAEARPPHA